MPAPIRKFLPPLFLAALVAGIGWMVFDKLRAGEGSAPGRKGGAAVPAAVEVAPVTRGPIELSRTFIGALESPDRFVVAPKVGGRIRSIEVDVSDAVRRGQEVARLDDDEFVQAVVQAEADLAVAKANLVEAKSALTIAERALGRVDTLRERGVASESQYDLAQADKLAKEAQATVAEAQIKRAEAALRSAQIRLSYTRVTADWRTGDEERIVAERYAEEGDTVSQNAPLLSIVALNRLVAAVAVTERDFVRLAVGQEAQLTTDAYPGEVFRATIQRIAPVFRESTRQARAELLVANPELRLKPGMFVRATVVLERVEDATIVPYRALARRKDKTGVFVVTADGAHVRWLEVDVGIREGELVQVMREGLSGRVVTLGQQLIDDGSAISIPGAESGEAARDPAARSGS